MPSDLCLNVTCLLTYRRDLQGAEEFSSTAFTVQAQCMLIAEPLIVHGNPGLAGSHSGDFVPDSKVCAQSKRVIADI